MKEPPAMSQTATPNVARVDVISDAICPWCYVGKHQLERAMVLLEKDGLTLDVHWHAFQLNPEMPAEGVDRRAYRTAKFGSWEKSLELDARIQGAGTTVDLDFRTDLMQRTPNTVDAHRVIRLAGERGVQDGVVEALFRGYFTEGADIGDHATLIALSSAAGLDKAEVTAMLASDAGRAEVLAEDSMARNSGLNGVPTFTMAGHVLFSGAVPADAMAEAFAKAWRILGKKAA
jgi:predicted DsbA family dithiol-disulfide isomerase